ncbi:MAG: hypothetical protein WEB55_01155 [Acidimicrobiia bacterium]
MTDRFPEPRPSARPYAMARLRRAMADEARRARLCRGRRRWIVSLATTVLVIGISPAGLDGHTAPLIGLADAVASAPDTFELVDRHWYSRTETRELVSVAVDVNGARTLEFLLLPAVDERRHDAGDIPRRTVTHGTPTFFSPEDEVTFHAAGLSATYGPGTQVTIQASPDEYRFAVTLADAEPKILESTLRRRVAGLGERRMEEVRLLQLTAELMQVHADDPGMRSKILRVIADVPGVVVVPTHHNVMVSIDCIDGDRPLRLMYTFDADSAHLVGEYLAVLATQSEPATILRSARHSLPLPVGVSES